MPPEQWEFWCSTDSKEHFLLQHSPTRGWAITLPIPPQQKMDLAGMLEGQGMAPLWVRHLLLPTFGGGLTFNCRNYAGWPWS